VYVAQQSRSFSHQFVSNYSLKTLACTRAYSSYRGSFTVETERWAKVRIPWSEFSGKGPGAIEAPFDSSTLTRVGVVAIGKEMNRVVLALSNFSFYTDTEENPGIMEELMQTEL
jgi:hypothetical protein